MCGFYFILLALIIFIFSTKNQGELAKFTIRIYYDCDKSEISITSPNMSPDFSVDLIQEEEEEAKKIDPDFKKLIEDAYFI